MCKGSFKRLSSRDAETSTGRSEVSRDNTKERKERSTVNKGKLWDSKISSRAPLAVLKDQETKRTNGGLTIV